MGSKGTGQKKAPDQTHAETLYLRRLVEEQATVVIRLNDNEEISGIIEFFDTTFLRLTRPHEPNLFIYKHDIKYLYEAPAEQGRLASLLG